MNIKRQNIEYTLSPSVKVSFLSVTNLAPHYHVTDLEIVYCFKGKVTLTSAFETITLSEGEYFTVSRYDIHSIQGDGDNILMTVHLDLTSAAIPWQELKTFLFVFESMDSEKRQEFNSASKKVNDILMLMGLLSSNGASHETLLEPASDKLLALLTNHFSYANYACQKLELPEGITDIFTKMSQYIYHHYSEKISLSTFAESLNFSKSRIASMVKNSLNLTFNYALNYVRCFHAEHLLLTTDKSNLDISNECGFSDSKYFYHHFKKWYGRTPNQHKEWYESHMKKADEYNEIPPAILKPFIENYYCKYHSEKTIAYIKAGK